MDLERESLRNVVEIPRSTSVVASVKTTVVSAWGERSDVERPRLTPRAARRVDATVQEASKEQKLRKGIATQKDE